ncbi:hypothetical protein B0H14DRAFT_2598503 [Mycena olivaceomarginata]|nr:hypothetical protein B0H14DRAFT_2598503 [Mycena olivaceomarginata]
MADSQFRTDMVDSEPSGTTLPLANARSAWRLGVHANSHELQGHHGPFSIAGQPARMVKIRDDNGTVVRSGSRLGQQGLATPAAANGSSTQQTLLGIPCRVSKAQQPLPIRGLNAVNAVINWKCSMFKISGKKRNMSGLKTKQATFSSCDANIYCCLSTDVYRSIHRLWYWSWFDSDYKVKYWVEKDNTWTVYSYLGTVLATFALNVHHLFSDRTSSVSFVFRDQMPGEPEADITDIRITGTFKDDFPEQGLPTDRSEDFARGCIIVQRPCMFYFEALQEMTLLLGAIGDFLDNLLDDLVVRYTTTTVKKQPSRSWKTPALDGAPGTPNTIVDWKHTFEMGEFSELHFK